MSSQISTPLIISIVAVIVAGAAIGLTYTTGAEGPIGPQGPTGADGVKGADGAQGPAGETPNTQTIENIVRSIIEAETVSTLDLSEGGKLYDKWWKVASLAIEPSIDNPLWASQDTNTRSGSTTWRCKECHGWDYKGAAGAYSSGSHYTGFIGVYDLRIQSISDIISSMNAAHDLTGVLDDDSITTLAKFISGGGMIDDSLFINYDTKEAIGGNVAAGNVLYDATCAICHGTDGTLLDFGDGEFVATIAKGNPWEFIHKVRFGQPDSAMPSAVVSGWSIQDVINVLAYAQTLPETVTINPASFTPRDLSKGGQLFDKWWVVASGAIEPSDDNPLWASQDTNTRSGSTTWRCKECHGWDYKGADGAYSSGSHYTGFKGLQDATTRSLEELLDALQGKVNANHDFSGVLDDESLTLLANFIAGGGVTDISMHIDPTTKLAIGGNTATGQNLFNAICSMCHGANGLDLDIDGAGVGAIARGNPWEFIHKVKFGQPNSIMTSSVMSDWSIQDVVDVLAFSQTLP